MKVLICSEYDINSRLMPSAIFARKYFEWIEKYSKSDEVFCLSNTKILFTKYENNTYFLDKSYNTKNSVLSIGLFVKKIFQHIIELCFFDKQYLFLTRKICKRHGIDCVVLFSWNTNLYAPLMKLVNKTNIKLIVITVDPVFLSPQSRKSIKDVNKEEKMIRISTIYFVPWMFLNRYKDKYHSNNINSFEFPCLLALEQTNISDIKKNTISYFGNLGEDRLNNDLLLFKSSKYEISFYGWYTDKVYNTYSFCKFFAPIDEESMMKIMFQSEFLLILDNSPIMKEFLPSKAITYASTTKPIIIFGKNKECALRKFLDEYNYPYYYHLEGNDINCLYEFMRNNSNLKFNYLLYQSLAKFLPINVFTSLHNEIKKNTSHQDC